MSGHKANRNNTPNRRPNDPTPTRMTALLDQLATDANTQRRNDPNMVALEPNLKALYAEYTRLCGHLDDVTAGAALLVVGQLCAAHVNRQPTEAKVEALASLPNLMRLVGAQLYAGTTTEVEIACPFTYLSGAPCTKKAVGATRGHAELLMKGHVWQNHPDEEWPPAEKGDSEIACSCGHPGCHDSANGGGDDCSDCTFYTSMLVGEDDAAVPEIPERERLVHDDPERAAQIREGIAEAQRGETIDLGPFAEFADGDAEDLADAVNLAPTDPAAQAAAIAELEAEFPADGEEADNGTGQCPECDGCVYVEDGRIGFHPTGEDGNQRTCPGAGRKPFAISTDGDTDAASLDGEVEN